MLSLVLNIGLAVVGGLAAGIILLLPDSARQGFLLVPWANMGPSEWVSISLLAAAILIGSIGTAIAYQSGPPAMIGAFDFAYVGFAVLWGLSSLPKCRTWFRRSGCCPSSGPVYSSCADIHLLINADTAHGQLHCSSANDWFGDVVLQ